MVQLRWAIQRRAMWKRQRSKEDNSISPFNSASKVNGLLMSETVESANNMLKCFYQLLFSGLCTHFWQLSCRSIQKRPKSNVLLDIRFLTELRPMQNQFERGVKMDELGGKEQDVPFLWQPVMPNQWVCSARIAKVHRQEPIHRSTNYCCYVATAHTHFV